MSSPLRILSASVFLFGFLGAALPSAGACQPGTCLISTWPEGGLSVATTSTGELSLEVEEEPRTRPHREKSRS